MPEQPLYLAFDDGDPAPTIVCSVDGHPPPTTVWTRDDGRDLPSGISQIPQSNGQVHLRWLRPMEFTDSGFYVCRASNSNGTSTAMLEVLVESKCYMYMHYYIHTLYVLLDSISLGMHCDSF